MRFSRTGYWGATAAGVLLVAIVSFATNQLMPNATSLVKGSILAASVAVAMAVSLLCYRSADEVILDTHKTAWFWGSMITFCFVLPLSVLIVWGIIPVPLLLPNLPSAPGSYFVEGILLVICLEAIGFSAISIYRWLP